MEEKDLKLSLVKYIAMSQTNTLKYDEKDDSLIYDFNDIFMKSINNSTSMNQNNNVLKHNFKNNNIINLATLLEERMHFLFNFDAYVQSLKSIKTCLNNYSVIVEFNNPWQKKRIKLDNEIICELDSLINSLSTAKEIVL